MTGTVTGPRPSPGGRRGQPGKRGQPGQPGGSGRPGGPTGPGQQNQGGRRNGLREWLGAPETGPARWVLATAVFAAIMASSAGLQNVLLGGNWVPRAILVVALTLLLPAIVRRWPRLAAFAPVAALAGWFMGLTLAFFPGTAYVGLIPSPQTIDAAVQLSSDAAATILVNSTPVPADDGITFVICAGLGFAALLVDTLAVTLSMPAASGLGLVLILLPASLTTLDGIGVAGLAAAAAGYLLILGCCRWYAPDGRLRPAANRGPSGALRRAAALGAAVVLVMVLLPAVIPGFTEGSFPQGARVGGPGDVSGLDPMISLGNDLRAQSGAVNLTYNTSATGPVYLRMSTLEDFSGRKWKPTAVPDGLRTDLGQLTPALGPNPAVPHTSTNTWIDVSNLSSPWLPAPTFAAAVSDLTGRWNWNPSTQTLSAQDTDSDGKTYVVRSDIPDLTPALLEAAAQPPSKSLDPIFLKLPGNVPSIIKDTANQLEKGQNTPYDRAMAIQNYLRSPVFTYSEKTPVAQGYDGAGMNVLAKFLEVKAGYCVHFSATMAVLAREMGIPSRIVVGYAPGASSGDTLDVGGVQMQGYYVTGKDAHAWPELYFEGLGWVPFEPTPSRGDVPSYAQAPSSQGSNLGSGDLLNGANSRPTPGADSTATASATASPSAAAAPVPATPAPARLGSAFAAVVLAVLALASPALTRLLVRRRRLALVRGAGSGRGQEGDGRGRGGDDGGGTGGDGVGAAAGGGGAGTRTAPAGSLAIVAPPDPRDAPELLAWRELKASAADFGARFDPSRTPSVQAAQVSAMLGAGDSRDVKLILGAYEASVYGPPSDGPAAGRDDLADALERIGATLASRAGAVARLRAVVLPPSLFTR